MKTKQIDEDELLDLLRTLPGKKSKYEVAAQKEAELEAKNKKKTSPKGSSQNGKTSSPVKSETPKTSAASSLSRFASPSLSQSSQPAASQSSQLTQSPKVRRIIFLAKAHVIYSENPAFLPKFVSIITCFVSQETEKSKYRAKELIDCVSFFFLGYLC